VLSIAAHSAPGRSGAAVSLVTTVGYSAFVLGPLVVGALASVTSLRAALALAVATMVAFALLARYSGVTYAPDNPPSTRNVDALT
jgi:MFS family permease